METVPDKHFVFLIAFLAAMVLCFLVVKAILQISIFCCG
jgi:hypothetical protein